MSDYLAGILDRKREEAAALESRAGALEREAGSAPAVRPWREALRHAERVTLIAELKRKAPSAGALRLDLDLVRMAQSYERAGAVALSVLTDLDFGGELDDLREAREAVSLPTLRKDFVLDPLQLLEARAAGADAALLIVSALSDAELRRLLSYASELGLGCLVEVHDDRELGRALDAGAGVIGINNRDLKTFETRLEVTHRLAPLVPADRVVVAESGIDSAAQVRELGDLGVDAVLVGSALVRETEPERLARTLASQPKKKRV